MYYVKTGYSTLVIRLPNTLYNRVRRCLWVPLLSRERRRTVIETYPGDLDDVYKTLILPFLGFPFHLCNSY